MDMLGEGGKCGRGGGDEATGRTGGRTRKIDLYVGGRSGSGHRFSHAGGLEEGAGKKRPDPDGEEEGEEKRPLVHAVALEAIRRLTSTSPHVFTLLHHGLIGLYRHVDVADARLPCDADGGHDVAVRDVAVGEEEERSSLPAVERRLDILPEADGVGSIR